MPAQPNMATILTTALEVASAMAFLHEHSIVHGDLTGGDLSRLGFRVQCGISQIGGTFLSAKAVRYCLNCRQTEAA